MRVIMRSFQFVAWSLLTIALYGGAQSASASPVASTSSTPRSSELISDADLAIRIVNGIRGELSSRFWRCRDHQAGRLALISRLRSPRNMIESAGLHDFVLIRVERSTSGVDPLLNVRLTPADHQSRRVLKIKTSADKTRILEIEIGLERLVSRFAGPLDNPTEGPSFQLVRAIQCQP